MAEQVSKIKKKLWYPIVAPKMFENAVLGETIVYDPNAMIGKTLTASLMNLIHDVKRQNVNIHFKVVGVEDGKATTSIVGYQIVPSSVKRLVRRNSEKINLSFACDTSDNVMMRVKPIVITRSAVKGSVQAKLRHNIVNFLVKSIADQSKVKTPSFFGYFFKYSLPILIPTFFLIWYLFFRV